MNAALDVAAFALKVLEKAPAIISASASVAQAAQTIGMYTEKVQLMVRENREPSPAEWDELNGRLDALEARLNSPSAGGAT